MKSRTYLLNVLFAALLLSVILPNILQAQVSWKIPIYLREGNHRDTLWFGYNPGVAGNCLDGAPILGFGCDSVAQSELPPPPPEPIAYFYFSFAERCSGSNGAMVNIKKYPFAAAPTKADTLFTIKWTQLVAADTVYWSWPAGLSKFASVMKFAVVGGQTVDMTTVTSVTTVQPDPDSGPPTKINISVGSAGIKAFDAAPPVPALSFPKDATVDVHLDTTFSWDAVAGVTKYLVQVSKNVTFTDLLVSKETTSTSIKVKLPKGSTQYYWRVAAANEFQRGCFSSTATITSIVTVIDPPPLLTPANASANVANPIHFTWGAMTGAISYQIQISSDNFAHAAVDSTLAGTSMDVTLAHCTGYKWRARTNNSTAAGPWTVTPFSFTVNSATPGVPVLSVPADNATGVDGRPVLSWAGDACSVTYHLQVSTDNTFTHVDFEYDVNPPNKQLDPLIGQTDYFWRVNARNTDGTSAYTAVRKFTTKVLPPAPPLLISPVAGADLGGIAGTLKWHLPVNSPLTYHVQVDTNPNFAHKIVDDSTIVDTTYAISGLQNCLHYFWRVSGKNAAGIGGYSTTESFITPSSVPGAPTLGTPADNTTGVDTQPTLTWAGDPCSQTFHLQVAFDNAFTNISFEGDINGLSKQLDPLIGQTNYFWRVNARSGAGTGPYSVIRKFTTKTLPPTIPALVSPINGVDIGGLATTLKWKQAFNNPTNYHVQVDTNSNFAHPFINDSSITTDTTYALASLLNCGKYFWRVSAKNSAGLGSYSVTGAFVTPTLVPGAPDLVSPADNASGLATTVTLTWTGADACSKRYALLVALDNGFTQVVVKETLSAASRTLTGLVGETDYYWKVSALNNGVGASGYTTASKFSTAALMPGVPVLVSPANATTLVGDAVTFVWRASSNKAHSYKLQVDTSAAQAFGGTLYKDITITDTTATVTDLIHCWVKYAWRVSATNPAGTSAFSSVRMFSTPRQIAGAPTLLIPPDATTGVADKPTLIWSGDPCSQTYNLQVSKDPAFGTLFIDQNLSATSFKLPTIEAVTVYYWRVYANNEKGKSPANVFHFTSSADQPPTAPDRVAPANGAIKVALSPAMSWDSTERAVLYHIQIARDTAFKVRVVDDSTVTGLVYHPGQLANNTTYYWRMRAKGGAGWGNFSDDYWSFTTLAPPAAPFSLSLPPNGVTYYSVTPIFEWALSDGAEYYNLDVATDAAFTMIVYTDTVRGSTVQYKSKLAGWTQYYWRVRGYNAAGYGPYSAVSMFKTRPDGIPNWIVPIAVSENGPMRDTVYFGINGRATYGIDPALYEFELPPPSFGIFDARFVDPDSRPGLLGQGLRVNRLPFTDYRQIDTFKLTFQPGTGSYPMSFAWPSELVADVCDSMILMDEFGGNVLHVRMDQISDATIRNTGISSLIIIEYAARPTVQSTPLGVDERHLMTLIPHGYQLYQNYPNPFNPTTQIAFSSDYAVNVRLGVYDVLGREVALLQDGSMSPGLHEVTWNGQNSSGMPVPSGVYYARIVMTRLSGDGTKDDRYTSVRKMLMLK